MAKTSTVKDHTYWATYEGKDLVDSLEERAQRYYRGYWNSIQWWRVVRNLRMLHGLWFMGAPDGRNYELRQLGGGHIGAAAGLFRTYLTQVLTLATGDKLAFKARAQNTDSRSMVLAALGPRIADHYISHRNGIKFLKHAAWNSLWGNAGYLYAHWNPARGRLLAPEGVDEDGSMQPPVMEGDFEFQNPTCFDVVFDFNRREWENVTWVVIRTEVSRYDLAAQYPQMAEKILAHERERQYEIRYWWNLKPVDYQSDLIQRYDFYHLSTPALPKGRHTTYLPDMEPLVDEDMPYDTLPIFRVCDGEFALNPFGYSRANDLQGMQEFVNGILSSLATNLAANAVGHIWQPLGEDSIRAHTYENGLRVLKSLTKPEPINFTAIPPESWKAFDLARALMELMSGVNAARLGQPEASLRSAKSIQVTIAQAFEAASAFAASYRDMAEDFATHIIKTIWKYAKGKRQVIMGVEDTQYLEEYDPKDLGIIDRIVVEAMDPIANSYAGRVAEAESLLQVPGMLKNPQDYVAVRETGSLEMLVRHERAEFLKIREENEALLRGEAVEVLPTDNHAVHIKEQVVPLLGSLRNARDPVIRKAVLAHATLHAQAILTLGEDPNWAVILSALGVQVMPPPTTMPATGGNGAMAGGPMAAPQVKPPPRKEVPLPTNFPIGAEASNV